jgi:glycosyltransferase involved in cell wall biosynthesis
MLLRIAHVSTTGTFLPKYYGSNEYLLCRGLAKRGHEVTLFIADRQPKWQTLKKGEIKKRIEEYEGFTIRRNFAGPEIGIIPLIPGLFQTLFHMDFDIIHAHDFCSMSSFYSAVVSRYKQIPFVLTQHNNQLPSKIVNAVLYLFDSFTIGRYILTNASKIIALNSDIRTHLLEMGADENKIEIIPNAIDTRFFSPNLKNLLDEQWKISHPVVLFVGRLVEDKGVRYLLEAFCSVVKEIPDAKLVIVGKGPEEEKLKILKRKLGLKNIFFLGAIENRFMPNIYTGCDIVVLPSIHEPFGNIVIEAMATGKPVIGSYVGGIKDTISHGVTGFHVPPRNSERISEFIIKLLSNPSMKEKMGKNARLKVVKKYNIVNLVRKIEDIYYDQCFH